MTDELERTHKSHGLFFYLISTHFPVQDTRFCYTRFEFRPNYKKKNCPDCGFRGFPQSPQANTEVVKLLINYHINFFLFFSGHNRLSFVYKVYRV